MRLNSRTNRIFTNITAGKNFSVKSMRRMSIEALIGATLFGFILGLYSGEMMLIYGPIKIPIVILATLAVCLPSMYVFSLVLNVGLSVKQISHLVFTNVYMLAVGLGAMIPIVWFFQDFYDNYRFNVLILVISFAASWWAAIGTTWGKLKDELDTANLLKLLLIWGGVFAFVSTQMIWIFRPWIGYTYIDEELPFIREIEGNVYDSVFLTGKTWVDRL